MASMHANFTRSADEMEALQARFENRDIVEANERMVIKDAFDSSCASNHFPEDLASRVHDLRWMCGQMGLTDLGLIKTLQK